MPKESLRDHLDGNVLDLSMSNLETVPVRELVTLPKATHLDLSNNKLTALPDGFCNLTHIVWLDLSKNALQELPKDFGQLENLQHLDLLGNQLKTLPRSFAQLHKLKWLDLKDNPLETLLKKNAGDCLDATECRKCAKRIMMYMKEYDSQLERQSQIKLKKQKELEAKKLEEEEKEKQRKRQEKRAEKERRRRELEAKRAQERLAQNADTSDEEVTTAKEKHKLNAQKSTKRVKSNGCGARFTLVLLSFLVLVLALLGAINFHCSSSQTDPYCVQYWHPSRKQFFTSAKTCWTFIVNFYHKHIEKYFFV